MTHRRARRQRFTAWWLLLVLVVPAAKAPGQQENGWNRLPAVLENIRIPRFPERDFDVTSYGAVGNGVTDATDAFRKAAEACNRAGGGRVLVPKGVFLTGPIRLKSNVLLYVSRDAIIKFRTDPRAYLPVVFTRWEGVECLNYSPLIYAQDEQNVGIGGEGLLDGQGSAWWPWKNNAAHISSRKTLFEMAEQNVPVKERIMGEGHFLRPNFVQTYRCTNVIIEGVTFKDSPMWFLHPVLSTNVSIQNVAVEGLGPNNDGCDPESCKDVLIRNCSFKTGDDCIAIKSGRNSDGRRVGVPSENIVIQGCTMKDGHGGVVIGSEISGGVRNVYAEQCSMDSPNLDRVLRIKTNSIRGGVVENVFLRDISVGEVADAVVKIDFFYEEGDAGSFTPVVRTIHVDNVKSKKSPYAVWAKAYARSPVTGFVLENCDFNNVAKSSVIENVKDMICRNVRVNGKPTNHEAKE